MGSSLARSESCLRRCLRAPKRRTVTAMASSFHGLSAKTLTGQPFAFDQLKGKVAVVLNVASR